MRFHFILKLLGLGLATLFILNPSPLSAKPFLGKTIQLPTQKIAPGESRILIDFQLPENHEYALEAPSTIWTRVKDPSLAQVLPVQIKPQKLDLSKLPHAIELQTQPGKTVVVIDIRAHFCDKDTQVCLTDLIRIKFPLEISNGAPSFINIQTPLSSKVFLRPKLTSATK